MRRTLGTEKPGVACLKLFHGAFWWLFGCLGLDERGAAVVPAVDEVFDGGDELFDAGEGAASDGLARAMMPKKISTMFIHAPEVGVKCMVTRGFWASQFLTLGCLCVA